MGFYIRKAIKVGPLRFNLSGSGVGVSAGLKGLRVGTGPRGNYIHAGRGGLYYRQSLGSRGSPATNQSLSPVPAPTHADSMEEIESGSALQMRDAGGGALLDELNQKLMKIRLFPLAIVFSTLAISAVVALRVHPLVFAGSIVALMLLCWEALNQDALRKTTVILYELEPEVEALYQTLHDSFVQLRSCGRSWHVEARGGVHDGKYQAGATGVLRRTPVNVKTGQPPLVKTNVEVPLIPVGKQTLAFMPDRLLIFDRAAIGSVSYGDLQAVQSETRFIESEFVAPDATVVGNTWQYVNKNGGPDRRFKNNREIPICLYDQIRFSSPSGLNEIVHLSCRGAGAGFAAALGAMRESPSQGVVVAHSQPDS